MKALERAAAAKQFLVVVADKTLRVARFKRVPIKPDPDSAFVALADDSITVYVVSRQLAELIEDIRRDQSLDYLEVNYHFVLLRYGR